LVQCDPLDEQCIALSGTDQCAAVDFIDRNIFKIIQSSEINRVLARVEVRDRIGTRFAEVLNERVSALLSCEDIIASAAFQSVITLASLEDVIACAASEAVSARATCKSVIARATFESISSTAAFEEVIACAASEAVIATAAFEDVIARAAFEGVTTPTTLEGYISRCLVGDRLTHGSSLFLSTVLCL
jgi:hypothetical protein